MLRKGHGGLYKAPTKEENERLRGERGPIKFIDLGFESEGNTSHKLHVLWINDDLWDRVSDSFGVGSAFGIKKLCKRLVVVCH